MAENKTAEAEKAEESKTVTLRLDAWPLDEFDHGIKGVPVITADGVEVAASAEKKVMDAAKEHGVTVKKVED